MKYLIIASVHGAASGFLGVTCAQSAVQADAVQAVVAGVSSGLMLAATIAFAGVHVMERIEWRSKRVASGCYGSAEQ